MKSLTAYSKLAVKNQAQEVFNFETSTTTLLTGHEKISESLFGRVSFILSPCPQKKTEFRAKITFKKILIGTLF